MGYGCFCGHMRGFTINRINNNPELNSTSKNDINDLTVQIAIVKSNRLRQLEIMKSLKADASSIIKTINEEYGLE
jgi:hypothetical protein